MKDYNYIKNLDMSTITEVKEYGTSTTSPEASIVIVTYNIDKRLLAQNLDSLSKQTNKDFEILIVDNSDKRDIRPIVSKYVLKYIKLNKNYGLSLGRNVGIKCAQGNIIIFLDDDAIPARDFVEKHIAAYKYNIFGLRGKSLPRTSTIYNYLTSHYDLGDQIIPYVVNLEGNSSFKRDILIKIGGFNPEIKEGGIYEGTELTYRIVMRYNDKNSLVYYPDAIIYHDYSNSFVKYLKKQIRSVKHRKILKKRFPDIFKFRSEYDIHPKKMGENNLSVIIKLKLRMIRKLTNNILKVYNFLEKHFEIDPF
ncbi:MAG: glycosyltransferase family 2 protein [Candidatus Hodarchaeota archaeon]